MSLKPTNLPTSAGVYLFKHRGKPIYIGKAKNLKKRLVSYWRKNADSKVKSLLQDAGSLEIIETESEIEALIKEAELIKKHLPKYNVLLRDDKNYFYVAITKEKFPRVFITHQPQLATRDKRQVTMENKKTMSHVTYPMLPDYIGPFTIGSALKITLKLLRRVFPYCTCKTLHKRPCLNSQIGRCLGFCCLLPSSLRAKRSNLMNEIATSAESLLAMTDDGTRDDNQKVYQKNIKNITAVLTGKKKSLLKNLKVEMQTFSKKQKFEEAGKIRDQILGIENIFAHRVILREHGDRRISRDPSLSLRMTKGGRVKNRAWPKIEKELQTIFNSSHKISRVEGYDISNISGRDATGSMVVFTNGLPDKKEYRQFRIKTVKQVSDVDMLKEIIKRRVGHHEWQNPDLMLIDGGKPQLNIVLSVIEYPVPQQGWDTGLRIVALAKKEEELYLPKMANAIKINNLSQPTSSFLKRVRDEAHRFARRYHHKLRQKTMLQ